MQFYKISKNLIQIFFYFLLFLFQRWNQPSLIKMQFYKKKEEIKTIIDDFREIIEVCGSNYSEKTVNTLKRYLTK